MYGRLAGRLSRRGKPVPTVRQITGTIKITGFTVTGKYGEYIATTKMVPPPNSGKLGIMVSGVPPEPVGYEGFDIP